MSCTEAEWQRRWAAISHSRPRFQLKAGSHLPDTHSWGFSSLLSWSFTQGTARRPHCTLHLTCGATDWTCQLCKICSTASEIPLPSGPFALCLKSLVSPGHYRVQTWPVRPISIKEVNQESSQGTREASLPKKSE